MSWQALFLPLKTAFNWALPPTCLECKKIVASDEALCPSCWSKITFLEAPVCNRLGLPLPYDLGENNLSPEAARFPPAFNRARAAFLYDNAGRALVTGLKFSDRLHLKKPLARWMQRAGRELLTDADMLIPVPLHWQRLFQRKFNQAAELAREISKLSGVAYQPHLLKRHRATRHQIGLNRQERRENLHEAFTLADGAEPVVHGKNIVLIDDVLTTGATAEGCARVLSRAGASRVDVLTAARVIEADKF